MAYATTKNSLKNTLKGTQLELECDNKEEIIEKILYKI